jgi:hypothetical protein
MRYLIWQNGSALSEDSFKKEKNVVGNMCIKLFKELELDKELREWLGNAFSGFQLL